MIILPVFYLQLKCYLFLMVNLNFQHHYSSLQSHNPSEIIFNQVNWLKCRFGAQETFLIIINVKNKKQSCTA